MYEDSCVHEHQVSVYVRAWTPFMIVDFVAVLLPDEA